MSTTLLNDSMPITSGIWLMLSWTGKFELTQNIKITVILRFVHIAYFIEV